MSYICPLCNGLWADEPKCPICHSEMKDAGRYMDFFDDYSPYLDIEGMKKQNGVVNDRIERECAHVFICASCGKQLLRGINEIEEY